jgi:hypothetical protein
MDEETSIFKRQTIQTAREYAYKRWMHQADRFGASPAARARLHVEKAEQKQDSLMSFLGKNYLRKTGI